MGSFLSLTSQSPSFALIPPQESSSRNSPHSASSLHEPDQDATLSRYPSVSFPHLGDQAEDEVVPVPDVLRSPQHHVVLLVEAEQEGEVTLPVRQTHPAHVTQPDLENDCLDVFSLELEKLRLV